MKTVFIIVDHQENYDQYYMGDLLGTKDLFSLKRKKAKIFLTYDECIDTVLADKLPVSWYSIEKNFI